MIQSSTRRGLLGVFGGVVGLYPIWSVLDGYEPPSAYSVPPPGIWPMVGYDPAGTWHNPYASGPPDGVSILWRSSGHDLQPIDAPLLANGTVYDTGVDTVGVSAVTGQQAFSRTDTGSSRGVVVPSSVYRNDSLVVASGARLAAVTPPDDPGTGTVRWHHRRPHSVRVPPVTDGRRVFVDTGRRLCALDPTKGVVLWEQPGSNCRPSIRNHTVFVAVGGRIRGYDAASGELTTSVTLPVTQLTSVVALDDRFVVRAGADLFCVTATGSLVWSQRFDRSRTGLGSVAVTDDTVYACVPDDTGRIVGAYSLESGDERWRSSLSLARFSPFQAPTVADGGVFVPIADGGVGALDAATGTTRWTATDPFDRSTDRLGVIAVGSTIYCSDHQSLYALGGT